MFSWVYLDYFSITLIQQTLSAVYLLKTGFILLILFNQFKRAAAID